MKRLLLLTISLISAYGFTQTTLFQDNFESGSSQWTLNTGSGDNNWVVNNSYLGFSGFIPDTPNQPGSFTNGTQSTYLHITNQSVCNGLSVCNANFDTGAATDQNAELSTAIDASAYSNVTVSFWYLCAGQSGTSFGTMEYSINGGASWVSTGTNYVNTSSWTQESVSLPAWSNAAALKIRFKWQNGGGGLDPAFSIDELTILGTPGVTNSITVDDLQPINAWCFGDVVTMQLTFTSVGTYNSANVYTAQISDGNGSFASPLDIGFINSSSSGTQLMPFVTIPGTIPTGTGYRIRVVASDPATIGSDNGSDLIVFPLPTVTSSPYLDVCLSAAPISLTGGMPSGGSYAGNGVSNGNFNPSTAGVGTSNVTYTYVDLNGCSNSVVETITVLNAPTAEFVLPFAGLCDIEPPYTFTEGTPAGGTYSGPGVTGGVFDPGAAGIGSWVISYTVSDPTTGCSDTTSTVIQVTPCFGLNENGSINYSIFPNPAEGSFSIVTEVQFDSIELKDLNGRVILPIGANQLIDVSQLSAGVYIIEMTYLGEHYAERIVIK